VRDLTQRRNVQTGLVRQTRRPRRQRSGQADHLVILDAPGRDDHHRRAKGALIRRQALFIQAAAIEQPAAATRVIIERHHLVAA